MPETTRSGADGRRVDLRDRDVHAVGRRAVNLVHAIAQPFHSERTTERQRVADRARLDVRRDDGDFAEVIECGGKRMDAVRMDAIVVGNQDSGHEKDRIRRGAEEL